MVPFVRSDRGPLSLAEAWDYAGVRAMLAFFLRTSPASHPRMRLNSMRVSLWRLACGGDAVWEAALWDGKSCNGLVQLTADVPRHLLVMGQLPRSALASLWQASVVALVVEHGYEDARLQRLRSLWALPF